MELTLKKVLKALPNRKSKTFDGQKERATMAQIADALGLTESGKVIPKARPKILRCLTALIDDGKVVRDGNRGSTTYRRASK